jgi:hypothetical protein
MSICIYLQNLQQSRKCSLLNWINAAPHPTEQVTLKKNFLQGNHAKIGFRE